jgi:diguanylate cyclase (GGDEF)-like protein/PAS domain S-box-containing protein
MAGRAFTQGTGLPCDRRIVVRRLVAAICLIVAWSGLGGPAMALKPISVSPDLDRIEITTLGEFHEGRGDSLQVDTAPGADGIAGRITVRAGTQGTSPNWIVFALHNPSDKPVERWLTAERYTVIGSGVIWPDLDARRIEAVTPSLGFLPDRVKSDRADIFRITLDPGQTITYVAELATNRFARVYLWKPLEYEVKGRDRQLFNGFLLGITGLLATFLTAVFAANHKAIFPSAALVAWCVLAYLCVDFGFWHKLFQLRAEDNAMFRAATESAVAASIVIFLNTFLRLSAWNGFVRMMAAVWIIAQLALVAIAVIDPRLAATFARASFGAIAAVGGMLTLYLALSGQDRALSLVPPWVLFMVWVFGAGVTLTGQMSGDIVVSGLVGGLVLIVFLLGLAVTQFAFRSFEPLYGAAPSEQQLRSLAIDGAGAAVWEWHARREEIKVSPIIEHSLGLNAGELSAKVDEFAKHLHPTDRERFRLLLWSVQERNGGEIRIDLRLRHADNSYRWFDLEAASVPNNDRRALRCIGLMRDVTDAKRAQERLMHDAVHDSLTGLPNREIFLDRLTVAVNRAGADKTIQPTILFIDIDKFKSVNSSFGLVVGDSLLLTVARRLQRHLGPQDTLARVAGDQFAILIVGEQDPRNLASLAERVRRSLRSPIKIAGQDIVLTASTGIAVYDGHSPQPEDLLKEAEIAMYRAKRGGADRIELFRAEMRSQRDDRIAIESDLRKALDKKQIKVLFQPIINLATEDLAGFEALVRWEHPTLGLLNPADFIPVAEESDLIVKLGSYVLNRAVEEAASWQKELPRVDGQLFVSVNVSSRQLFRQDLIQEIRHIIGRAVVPAGSLMIEITESLLMENPEQASEILQRLRSVGATLALDDFGSGYSSLSYLNQFPFDVMKIDRGLVQAGVREGAASAIVRSIAALAHELGKKVVAEGVEAAEDAGFLRSLGFEYAQGFYYGEPMSDRDVMALLKVVRKSERKLQRRGFFRTKPKPVTKKAPAAPKPDIAASAVDADASLAALKAAVERPEASPAGQPHKPASAPAAARPSRPGSHLPASTVRPRTRTGPAAARGAAEPAISRTQPLPLRPASNGSQPPRGPAPAVPPTRPPALPAGVAPFRPAGPAPIDPSGVPPTGPRPRTAPPPIPPAAPPAQGARAAPPSGGVHNGPPTQPRVTPIRPVARPAAGPAPEMPDIKTLRQRTPALARSLDQLANMGAVRPKKAKPDDQ